MTSVTLERAPAASPTWLDLLAAAVRHPATWAIALTLLGFFLRVWQLDAVPPGFRDDELIETLVISQNILDGDIALYYPDASGHEPLYHMLNALFLAWFGPGALGIRLLSAMIGTLTIPLTYVLGRKLFGPGVALAAAGALAVSFWGLMYARVGIRHVLTPPFVLAAFYFFWRGLAARGSGDAWLGRWFGPGAAAFALAGVNLGLGFYVYFAGRGVVLVPVGFAVYLALVAWPLLRARWRGMALMLIVMGALALPLFVAIGQQPEAEGRVGELALPVIEAQAGDFGLLIDHTIAALTTAHSGGDPEWLYNIPGRPIFGPVGAVFFWGGVLLAVVLALRPIGRLLQRRLSPDRSAALPPATPHELAAAFLLIWWLVGISPAILSVPEASLGHMIMAQSAFYMLAALPVMAVAGWRRLGERRLALAALAGVVLMGAVALRDLPAYFNEWPQRGMVRFLYRADIADVADFIRRDPANPAPGDFGITGLLAGPWDREALSVALGGDTAVRPRWYNPERALLLQPDISFSGYPDVPNAYAPDLTPLPEGEALAGGYRLVRVDHPAPPAEGGPVCFANHLCWTGAAYDPATGVLELGWRADDHLDLPPLPLISNPPPPGVYNGPRLYVFAQLLDASGAFLVGDDGLWVDPSTLQPGDAFVQQHWLRAPDGTVPAAVLIGMYDPLTGERVLTVDGADHIRLEVAP
jgi:4-amino-4-deoxy-L-arabinose transferase-like glycosyltransferase